MIPVFQTRYAAATFGNCFEACLASILELPLTAIPDRAALVDQDAWADLVQRTRREKGETAILDLELPDTYDQGEDALRAWLRRHGIGWLDFTIGTGRDELPFDRWLEVIGHVGGYWIAHTRTSPSATSHATVWLGRALAHNPSRSWPAGKELGPLHAATLLTAANPPWIARRLEPLPDLAGELEELSA